MNEVVIKTRVFSARGSALCETICDFCFATRDFASSLLAMFGRPVVSYIHQRINHQPIHSAIASVVAHGIADALAAYVCSAFSLARRLPRVSPALRARAGRGQGDASNRGTESLANDPRSAHDRLPKSATPGTRCLWYALAWPSDKSRTRGTWRIANRHWLHLRRRGVRSFYRAHSGAGRRRRSLLRL